MLNTEIYDINSEDGFYFKNKNLKETTFSKAEEPSNHPIEIAQKEPVKNHPKTNNELFKNQHAISQNPSMPHQRSHTKPLTNKETLKNEKENKQATRTQGSGVALYPCLKELDGVKGFKLADDEKLGLMAYPIDRVAKAIDYASHPAVTVKKDLISLLHWHCKNQNPVAPPDESDLKAIEIPQHKLAYEYNEFLKEGGFLKQVEANLKSIPQGITSILDEGGWTTVSLNSNSVETLRSDFSKSKDLIRKRNHKDKS